MLASPRLGKRSPTEGDASIPTPLHAAPAPTRSRPSQWGSSQVPTLARTLAVALGGERLRDAACSDTFSTTTQKGQGERMGV